MSVRQILRAKEIIVAVPGDEKSAGSETVLRRNDRSVKSVVDLANASEHDALSGQGVGCVAECENKDGKIGGSQQNRMFSGDPAAVCDADRGAQ